MPLAMLNNSASTGATCCCLASSSRPISTGCTGGSAIFSAASGVGDGLPPWMRCITRSAAALAAVAPSAWRQSRGDLILDLGERRGRRRGDLAVPRTPGKSCPDRSRRAGAGLLPSRTRSRRLGEHRRGGLLLAVDAAVGRQRARWSGSCSFSFCATSSSPAPPLSSWSSTLAARSANARLRCSAARALLISLVDLREAPRRACSRSCRP